VLVRADLPQARRQALPGLQIHVDDAHYDHAAVPPVAPAEPGLQGLRQLQPDYPLWRDFPYEYEHERLAIDLINGSPLLREWVDDPAATPADLDALTRADEDVWEEERVRPLDAGTGLPRRLLPPRNDRKEPSLRAIAKQSGALRVRVAIH
jgi:hypothetical protein